MSVALRSFRTPYSVVEWGIGETDLVAYHVLNTKVKKNRLYLFVIFRYTILPIIMYAYRERFGVMKRCVYIRETEITRGNIIQD